MLGERLKRDAVDLQDVNEEIDNLHRLLRRRIEAVLTNGEPVADESQPGQPGDVKVWYDTESVCWRIYVCVVKEGRRQWVRITLENGGNVSWDDSW